MDQVIDLKLFGEVFLTLLVIIDPPGVIPIFLALTATSSVRERRRAVWQAVAVSFAVIVSFAVVGQQGLSYLGISIPALEVAGGLLLLLVALELLTGREQPSTQVMDVNVALVPLGTPLLAGPGAIVATIVFAQQVHRISDLVAVGAAIIAVHLVLYLSMRYSDVLLRLFKENGIALIGRIAGLLLSAIAVELVAGGVIGFIENYQR